MSQCKGYTGVRPPPYKALVQAKAAEHDQLLKHLTVEHPLRLKNCSVISLFDRNVRSSRRRCSCGHNWSGNVRRPGTISWHAEVPDMAKLLSLKSQTGKMHT